MSQEKSNTGGRDGAIAAAGKKTGRMGWVAIPTAHGTRFHRERGKLHLDVELQITTWVCSATEDGVLMKVARGFATAERAARAIEEWAEVPHKNLPKDGAGT